VGGIKDTLEISTNGREGLERREGGRKRGVSKFTFHYKPSGAVLRSPYLKQGERAQRRIINIDQKRKRKEDEITE